MQLKLYGRQQKELSEINKEQVESIGYTLPETYVSSEFIPIGSDVIFTNLYTSILCILHSMSVCLIIYWYYDGSKYEDHWIDDLINDSRYDDLLLGIRITSNTTLCIEVLIRLITIIIWTQNSLDSIGIFLAVWLPNLQLLAIAIGLNAILNICKIRHNECCNPESKSGLRTFFTLYGTLFVLLYLSFSYNYTHICIPTQYICNCVPFCNINLFC